MGGGGNICHNRESSSKKLLVPYSSRYFCGPFPFSAKISHINHKLMNKLYLIFFKSAFQYFESFDFI